MTRKTETFVEAAVSLGEQLIAVTSGTHVVGIRWVAATLGRGALMRIRNVAYSRLLVLTRSHRELAEGLEQLNLLREKLRAAEKEVATRTMLVAKREIRVNIAATGSIDPA